MKKLVSSLLVLTFALGMGNANARNVTEEMAKKAGAFYLRTNTGMGKVEASSLTLLYTVDNPSLGVPACYVFNVGRSGWIVMGGTTATSAVACYSECGTLEQDNMPYPMVSFIEDYAEFVSEFQNNDNGKFVDLAEWDDLLNERQPSSPKDADEEVILMAETWDQGGDNGTDYNMYAPIVAFKYCPTGCVATALGQICHYYKYPVQPKGTKSYSFTDTINNVEHSFTYNFDSVSFDYSLMPNSLTYSSSLAQRREVSKLGYALGMAVEMHYKPQGSGAHSYDVPDAMKKYFKYSKGSLNYRRSSFTGQYAYYLNYAPWSSAINDEAFLRKLRLDLRRNRPVYMGGQSSSGSGRDAGGHAWVCCGFKQSDDSVYYMNWGWGSVGNGWYRLVANNMYIPSQGYNFKLLQEHITGMIPPKDSVDFEIMRIVGIDDVEEVAEVMPAYPNPASYSVTIPYAVEDDATLTVMSVDGKAVLTRRLNAGKGEAVIDVRNMPAGIYVYRVNGLTGKFLVQ